MAQAYMYLYLIHVLGVLRTVCMQGKSVEQEHVNDQYLPNG